jgi:hypothetical protein
MACLGEVLNVEFAAVGRQRVLQNDARLTLESKILGAMARVAPGAVDW